SARRRTRNVSRAKTICCYGQAKIVWLVKKTDLLIHPIGELATTRGGEGPAHGRDMGKVERIKDGALAVAGDTIVAAGAAEQVLAEVEVTDETKVIDASNKLVIPGFVDPHTHLVFAGN